MMKTFLFATVAAVLAAVPCFAQEKNPVVVMETSLGTMQIELYPKQAPMTVKNFLEYVEAKHYDGTIFHRVIEDFMIQGGGFDAKMNEKKTKAPIKNEAGLPNERGTLAMARTSAPHSASAQFFINSKKNSFLDKANAQDGWGYAVFGKVIDGLDVLDKIRKVQTGKKVVNVQGQNIPFSDVPVEPVTIKSVRVLKGQ